MYIGFGTDQATHTHTGRWTWGSQSIPTTDRSMAAIAAPGHSGNDGKRSQETHCDLAVACCRHTGEVPMAGRVAHGLRGSESETVGKTGSSEPQRPVQVAGRGLGCEDDTVRILALSQLQSSA